jgi:hypothetical protein
MSMPGSGFTVAPNDLMSAAGMLASVRGELGAQAVSGSGGTGTGALDGALAALSARLEFVAAAMDEAITATSQNLVAGSETYASTDSTQFRGRGGG